MPITKYECKDCGVQYLTKSEAITCEQKHKSDKSNVLKSGKDICEFCVNRYYAYGCEAGCEFEFTQCSRANNYKKFLKK